jgi:phosphonate degradation associated HDIG domain protein
MKIIDLYLKHGNVEYIGEPVSQLEHASQAAELAMAANASIEVVIAAFLHDIGHLCVEIGMEQMDGFGALNHEQIGADYLKAHGLPTHVVHLVESHVQAKRYLTYKDPLYFDSLSDASRTTLRWQGGPMTELEASKFEQDPEFETILQLRKWDEQAKIEGKELIDLQIIASYLNEIGC